MFPRDKFSLLYAVLHCHLFLAMWGPFIPTPSFLPGQVFFGFTGASANSSNPSSVCGALPSPWEVLQKLWVEPKGKSIETTGHSLHCFLNLKPHLSQLCPCQVRTSLGISTILSLINVFQIAHPPQLLPVSDSHVKCLWIPVRSYRRAQSLILLPGMGHPPATHGIYMGTTKPNKSPDMYNKWRFSSRFYRCKGELL